METFDKSNFKSEQHAQWQDMFNRVNDSMDIWRATFAPPLSFPDYLQSIMKPDACQQLIKCTGIIDSYCDVLVAKS